MGGDTINKSCLCHCLFFETYFKKKNRGKKKEGKSSMKLGNWNKHKAKSMKKGYPGQEN